MSQSHPKPDVRQLGCADFTPEAANVRFPGAGSQDFRIYFTPEAHKKILQHAAQTAAVEIGGVLVGRWNRDDDGPYVAITEIIRCDEATSKSGEVTFTHEAWNVVNREMDTKFSDLKIVGWYHSHPGFGVFLSERDRFIQEHFFSNPGQIAYVVDPLACKEGVFAWRNAKPAIWPHYWIGDRIYATTNEESETKINKNQPPSTTPEANAKQDDGGSILLLLQRAALYVLIFMVGFLWASGRSAWEDRMLINGAVAHYGVWKGLRPGLRENLDAAGARLAAVSEAVKILSAEHLKAAGEGAEKKKEQWNDIKTTLQNTQMLLGKMAEVYGLSQEEEATLAKIVADKMVDLETVKKTPAKDTGAPSKKAEK